MRSQLQYRTSFALEAVGQFVISFIDFVGILIIFANVRALGAWSVSEVALLYGIACTAFAFTDLAVGHLDEFPRMIRDGSFDLLLVRPRGTLFQVVSADFQIRRLGRIAQALVVLAFAMATLGITWDAPRVALLVAAIASGALIFAAVWVGVICIAFWTVEGRESANAFTYGGVTLAQFPIDIYDQWLRRFFAYVVPTAFVAYFPALAILGKADSLGLPSWLSYASPLVGITAAVVAANVWGWAVRHYRSAGG